MFSKDPFYQDIVDFNAAHEDSDDEDARALPILNRSIDQDRLIRRLLVKHNHQYIDLFLDPTRDVLNGPEPAQAPYVVTGELEFQPVEMMNVLDFCRMLTSKPEQLER